jgi:hypothetical protein
VDPLRFAALCVVLAGAETLHGIARTVLIAPRIGKARAIQLSVVSGSALAFGICYLLVPSIGAVGWRQHGLLGLGIASFMAAFDVAIGRWVMRFKWSRIGQDFDPRSGNYLSIGLLLLVFMPGAVAWLRGGLSA